MELPKRSRRITEQCMPRENVGHVIQTQTERRRFSLLLDGYGIPTKLHEAGLFGVPEQAVFGQELIELRKGEVVLISVKADHVEDLRLPIVEVNCTRGRIPWVHLEK